MRPVIGYARNTSAHYPHTYHPTMNPHDPPGRKCNKTPTTPNGRNIIPA